MFRGFWVAAANSVSRWARLGALSAGLHASADGFVHPAPRGTDFNEGELLLGELNCVGCHAASAGVAARLDSRGSPKIGAEGLRLTPHWLQRWLQDPAAAKPGSAMPHLLHGLPAEQRAEAVVTLAHFLVSVAPTNLVPAVRADPARAEAGKALYHSVGCVACHAPAERAPGVTEEVFQRAQITSVPLGELASKYPAGELVRFLLDPVRHRPGARMPSSGLTESEATAIATYLLRDQLTDATRRAPAPVSGLQFEYFEGRFGTCAEFESRQPAASGVSPTVDPKVTSRPGNFGLRFQGVLDVPSEGEYTFWLNSDDGSQLLLDGKRLIDNDGEHAPVERSGKTNLRAGPHSFTVLFYQNGGGYELNLQWAGPDFTRREIPASAFSHFVRPMVPVGAAGFVLDVAQAARGREWFSRLNCGACHAVAGLSATMAKPLLELTARSDAGCLADSVPASAPKFGLSAAQRQALRQTVANAGQLAAPVSAKVGVAHMLTRLNCYACHDRDGLGGPLESGRADWFQVVGEVDLGDEGRLPPHLTAVGGKLQPAWLLQVLSEGSKVRPYMATRMPRFGPTAASLLPSTILQADAGGAASSEPALSARDAKVGWKLVGRDGFNCIACHTFAALGSTGVPALALDSMAHRLQWAWFRRYLPDPAALRPGTRMPTFWPEGQSVKADILGGNTEAQIQALWAWLKEGAKAEVPTGLVRGRQELVVNAETVIYRNFIEGAGSRAIGVGYPEHANLAFDANELRLALIWQGSFIDTARHSTDRGVGYEPPLGDHRIQLPAGPAFAPLVDAAAPWPAPPNRLGTIVRFLGYTLDAAQRPTFRYRLRDVIVEETPLPRPGEVDMTLVRRFKLEGRSERERPLYFRAAKGAITTTAPTEFTVDHKLRLKFVGAGDARIVGDELRWPVSVPGEFTLEMTW